MTYLVQLTHRAEKYFGRLDHGTKQRISDAIREIGEDPFRVPLSKALQGHPGNRSVRVGGYRIIYFVDRTTQQITVEEIGPRGQVYRRLD